MVVKLCKCDLFTSRRVYNRQYGGRFWIRVCSIVAALLFISLAYVSVPLKKTSWPRVSVSVNFGQNIDHGKVAYRAGDEVVDGHAGYSSVRGDARDHTRDPATVSSAIAQPVEKQTASPIRSTQPPEEQTTLLPVCPYPSPKLTGVTLPRIRIDTGNSESTVEKELFSLLPGGCWKPPSCRAYNGDLAILIPSHGRHDTLIKLLRYLVPLLQRQQQDFCIFAANQSSSSAGARFNKGAIIDALFVEAMQHRNWTCVCVHDVDLIPENDHNSYSCPHTRVVNLIGGTSKWSYHLAYPSVFGGVTISMVNHFRRYNGFTTAYWGWGSEDDDHRMRVVWAGLNWTRSDGQLGRYTHVNHESSPTNPDRFALVPHARELWQVFGLNTLRYSVEFKHVAKLYAQFTFRLPKQGQRSAQH